MRLTCDVDVVSRLLPSQGFRGKNRAARTFLAIGKKSCPGIAGGLFLMLCTAKDRRGSKYKLKENVEALFTKFIGEGKATVRIREPAHDLFLSKADPLQLKSFLSAIKLGHQDKELKSVHLTSLTPATVSQIERPKTKLDITERKDYPITTSFAKSLQTLRISNCKLRRFDSRILDLKHLVCLDLSFNAIENLPDSWGRLKSLSELNLSNNKLKCISKSFIQSSLSHSLCSLDLSVNCLQAIPHQLCGCKNLVRINLSENQLKSVPYGVGNMSSLKFLNLSMNALQSVPSSFVHLRLDEIDLHGNPFTLETGVNAPRPESTAFPSLLEVTGQAVVRYGLPYCGQLLPVTVCMFLDGAMVCQCGRVCFKPYVQPTQRFNAHNIASSVIKVNGVGDVVPMSGILCSWYCSQLWRAGGPAWRAWCQKGTTGMGT